MLEPRPYTPAELLAWCRLTALTLTGLALAYTREREGTVDGFVAYAAARLGETWGALGTPGVEATTLLLQLSAEALGGDVRSRAMTAEEGEVLISGLPGDGLCQALEDHFDMALTVDDILAVAGASQEELNRLYDVLGGIVAGAGYVYDRELEGDDQRLTVRA
ncbi:MAG: hypothetical protein QJR03_10580 [Sphaerobacter sp.]|nr:hypothetical protein [Sphaerobacter sp.]